VRLSPLGTSATNWSVIPAPDDIWWMWRSRWNENWQGRLPLRPPQIQHDLGSNPGRCGAEPASNYLSYATNLGIIISIHIIWCYVATNVRIVNKQNSIEFAVATTTTIIVTSALSLWQNDAMPERGTDLPLFRSVQTGSGFHLASYSRHIRGRHWGGGGCRGMKMITHLHLRPWLRMRGTIPPSPWRDA
jgi:hypothetical protein